MQSTYPSFYLLGNRWLTHGVFWLAYYIIFSVIWMKPEQGYFASFYLEFVLMPVRMMAAYAMVYVLIPEYLAERRYRVFISCYAGIILVAAMLQMTIGHFFYERLLLASQNSFQFSFSAVLRNAVLVNSTVLLLGTLKVFQLYIKLREQLQKQYENPAETITVKSERRMHCLKLADILFVEGLGNYVTYHLTNGQKYVVYNSIKQTQDLLPDSFLRVHRSYIVNRDNISSYNKESICLGNHDIPRGKDIPDESLAPT
ncbi:MAG: LytR/AlgR family response regulator transcription factor [Aestuariibacter sp.]